jgi:cytochrome P450
VFYWQDEQGNTYAQPQYRSFLRDVLLNFVTAGRDSTACLLTWIFYNLSTNPKIQQKLCEEVDAVLEGREPGPDDITPAKMPYLNGLVYETLRLFPPVPYVRFSIKLSQFIDSLLQVVGGFFFFLLLMDAFMMIEQDTKLAMQDDTLPDGTVIPKHTLVTFFPYAMGRDPERSVTWIVE